MSLTVEQMAARKGKLTASRVACLMTGEKGEIMRLYREMIGEFVEQDLSNNWPVQLGSATEAVQLEWYVKQTGRQLEWRNQVVVHPKFEWAAATPDAWDRELQCPVECKHIMQWKQIEEVREQYFPQLHWQMWCTGATRAVLSCIRVVAMPMLEYVDCDEGYLKELISRASTFMLCVATKTPPVDMPPIKVPVDPTRVVDMTGNNEWGDYAGIWLENAAAHHQYETAKEGLKAMVPEDARRVFGAGVQVTRAKNGALTVRND